jgi:hypothetical protein
LTRISVSALPHFLSMGLFGSSTANRIAQSHEAWKQRTNKQSSDGITTFRSVGGYDPEDELITQLAPIVLRPLSYLLLVRSGVPRGRGFALAVLRTVIVP